MSKQAEPGDWRTKALPDRHTTLRLDRAFSSQEVERIRLGVIPVQMEDKWFIYWKDDSLYFHRSWTGFCVFIVRFAAEGRCWRMVEADVNRDPEQYEETNDDRDAALISCLVDRLLLHRPAEFPAFDLPADQQVLMQWSLIGRALQGEHPSDGSDEHERFGLRHDATTDDQPDAGAGQEGDGAQADSPRPEDGQ